MRAQWFNTAGLTAVLFCAALLSAGSPGIRPRACALDYPVHQATAAFTVGAAVIPPGDVKKILAADLHRAGYVVIEVGVYPSPGKDIDLSPADFMLLTDGGGVANRPVDAGDAAAVIGREHRSSPADVYTTTGAAISHGSAVDPATGRRVGSTVVGVEAGVGVGTPPVNYPLPAAGPNLGAMEQELWAKSFPDGRTAAAVAGYLYFPKPSGKTNGAWELAMDGAAGRVKLTLQTPARR